MTGEPIPPSSLRLGRPIELLLGCSIALVAAAVLWMGAAAANDTFDAYDYMTGARALAGSHPEWYPSIRPFGPALTGAPWAALWSGRDQAMTLFRSLHLQSAAVTLLFIAVCARLFRRLGGTGVLLPVALLSLCRLVPRYGWSFLSDIPAALLVAAGFLLVIRRRPTRHDWWTAGLLFGLAGDFKFYLLASAVVGAVAWRIVRRGRWSEALGLAAVGVAAGVGIHLAGAALLTGGSLPPTSFWLEVFGGQVSHGAKMAGGSPEVWWSDGPLFVASFGFLAPVLLGAGLIEALRSRGPSHRLALLWTGGLGLFVVASGHHEARYLFPILPPLVWLTALGAMAIGRRVSTSARDRRPMIAALAWAAALVPAAHEAVGLSESWLRRPVQQTMCRRVVENARPGEPILFAGPFYPLILSRQVFSEFDAQYGIFHLGPSQLTFWEQRPARLVLGRPSPSGLWIPTNPPAGPGPSELIVTSGYRVIVETPLVEAALRDLRPVILLRRETLPAGAPVSTGLPLIDERWFERGSSGGWTPAAPPTEGDLPSTDGLLRSRIHRLASIRPF